MSEFLRTAISRSPSLVVFDDLDKLVPASSLGSLPIDHFRSFYHKYNDGVYITYILLKWLDIGEEAAAAGADSSRVQQLLELLVDSLTHLTSQVAVELETFRHQSFKTQPLLFVDRLRRLKFVWL